MKKSIFLVLMLLVGLTAKAQESVTVTIPSYNWQDHRHSLSLTVGTPSFFSSNSVFGWEIAPGAVMSGTYTMQYGYNILRWLRLGGSVSYEFSQMENHYHSHYVNALVRVNFTYINREHIRLYSGLGMGILVQGAAPIPLSATDDEREKYTTLISPGGTATLIGVEAGGDKVFGLAELNIGTCDVFRAGIGFRF